MTTERPSSLVMTLDCSQLADELKVLIKKEGNYAVADYLNSGVQPYLSATWRHKIVQWMYDFVDYHHYEREVVAKSISLLDRFLSAVPNCERKHFQLCAMTTLFLAMKINRQRKCISISQFVQYSRGEFGVEDILKSEKEILDTLNWHVHPPTPQSFFHYIGALIPKKSAKQAAWEIADFIIEVSIHDYFFATMKASSIAMAAWWYGLDSIRRIDSNIEKIALSAREWEEFSLIVGHVSEHELSFDCMEVREAFMRMSTHSTYVDALSHFFEESRFESSSPTFVCDVGRVDNSGLDLKTYAYNSQATSYKTCHNNEANQEAPVNFSCHLERIERLIDQS